MCEINGNGNCKRYMLKIFSSAKDSYANVYTGFYFKDLHTDKSVRVLADNIDFIRNDWDGVGTGWSDDFIVRYEIMPKREFNRFTKGWINAGCNPDEIRAFIKAELEK